MRPYVLPLATAKGNCITASRSESTTFNNILEMYNMMYVQMIDAGLAKDLSIKENCWMNHCGDRVKTEEEAFRSKIKVEITHLEWILSGDEVGTYINQKEDGKIAGNNYCDGKSTRANIKSNTNSGRFTVIGSTSTTSGDHALCIVILRVRS
jgi:hypothetical protein